MKPLILAAALLSPLASADDVIFNEYISIYGLFQSYIEDSSTVAAQCITDIQEGEYSGYCIEAEQRYENVTATYLEVMEIQQSLYEEDFLKVIKAVESRHPEFYSSYNLFNSRINVIFQTR